MPLIDAHTHLFAPAQRDAREAIAGRDATFAEMYGDAAAEMATSEELRAELEAAGLDGAAVAGFAFGCGRDIAEQNEYLLAAGKVPGLVPLATVNPATEGWLHAAERNLAGGARGFGELRPGSQGWDPLGPEGRRLGALAAETGAVLLWHVSEPVGHSYPGKHGGIGARELYELAVAFPGARMIAAHLGGGLSFFLQMPEVREALHNVWFDTAAYGLLYDDGSVARLVDLSGPGRVLFGSDYPLLSPRRQLQRIKALLPGDVAQAVCGGNAKFLFPEKRNP